MNQFFSFRNKKFYFGLPNKKPLLQPRFIKYFARPKHTFQQGLITRLANPAGCGCGK